MFLAINERLTNDKLLINNSYGTMKIRKIKKKSVSTHSKDHLFYKTKSSF